MNMFDNAEPKIDNQRWAFYFDGLGRKTVGTPMRYYLIGASMSGYSFSQIVGETIHSIVDLVEEAPTMEGAGKHSLLPVMDYYLEQMPEEIVDMAGSHGLEQEELAAVAGYFKTFIKDKHNYKDKKVERINDVLIKVFSAYEVIFTEMESPGEMVIGQME